MVCKLLLVDDEEKMVKYLSKRLDIRGFDVVKAYSGEEALSAVKKRLFDVVLLDVFMPGMDGIETLKAIKEVSAETEVILLSGHSSAKTEAEGRKWGAFAYVSKPIDLNALIEKINLAVHQRLPEENL